VSLRRTGDPNLYLASRGRRRFEVRLHGPDDERGYPRGWAVQELTRKDSYGQWVSPVADGLRTLREARNVLAGEASR